MDIEISVKPSLDPSFSPAAMWNKAYRDLTKASSGSVDVTIALLRPDGSCSRYDTIILPLEAQYDALSLRYLERVVKFLLWQRGGSRVFISGCDALTEKIAMMYSKGALRGFDQEFFGSSIYRQTLEVVPCRFDDIPEVHEKVMALGGHLDGCRIGFDLGGSDRKCAAVIDGKVVFSEEIAWDPYFEKDPQYHIDGIHDSLKRAAAHLPQVDAIGGSAAGVYVNNEVCAASLFRGISEDDFDAHIRRIFLDVKKVWNDVPFEVVNDGDVTALAGSLSLKDGSVLGVSMGTSQAVGYCDSRGHITHWLNELAFAPVDYSETAPVDEWSGDIGCGVQCFSQQGVARLASLAGFSFPESLPLAERLVQVQGALEEGDDKARKIFESIGTCFGYGLAHYADFYDLRNVLILGRVTSGDGGQLIIAHAEEVLRSTFPALNEALQISMPDEEMKRHGQAVAAASLPTIC